MLTNTWKHGRATRECDVGVEFSYNGKDATIDVWLKRQYRVLSLCEATTLGLNIKQSVTNSHSLETWSCHLRARHLALKHRQTATRTFGTTGDAASVRKLV